MKKISYLVPTTIFFLILMSTGFWVTLNGSEHNRITGQFLGWNNMTNLFIPWVGVIAFVVFVMILNFKKQ